MNEEVETVETDQAENLGEDTKVSDDKDIKNFSQDEVNGIAAKEAKKAQEKLLKDLGIDDFENAKEGFEKFKQWQEQQKTDQEKLDEAIKTKDSTIQELQASNKSLEAKVVVLGKGVQADSVDDVVALAERLVTEEVTLDDAVSSVLEKYPHFLGTEQPSKQSVAPGNPARTQTNDENDPFKAKLAKYQ